MKQNKLSIAASNKAREAVLNDGRLRILAETFLADNFHAYSESTILNLMTLLASQSTKEQNA